MPNPRAVPRQMITIKFPKDLLDEVDAVVAAGARSAWIVEACRERLGSGVEVEHVAKPAGTGVRSGVLDRPEVSPRFKR